MISNRRCCRGLQNHFDQASAFQPRGVLPQIVTPPRCAWSFSLEGSKMSKQLITIDNPDSALHGMEGYERHRHAGMNMSLVTVHDDKGRKFTIWMNEGAFVRTDTQEANA